MSYEQEDGKKPVYKTTRGAGGGSNWMILLPIYELAWLFSWLKGKL